MTFIFIFPREFCYDWKQRCRTPVRARRVNRDRGHGNERCVTKQMPLAPQLGNYSTTCTSRRVSALIERVHLHRESDSRRNCFGGQRFQETSRELPWGHAVAIRCCPWWKYDGAFTQIASELHPSHQLSLFFWHFFNVAVGVEAAGCSRSHNCFILFCFGGDWNLKKRNTRQQVKWR